MPDDLCARLDRGSYLAMCRDRDVRRNRQLPAHFLPQESEARTEPWATRTCPQKQLMVREVAIR
jgi:hypothetical protein